MPMIRVEMFAGRTTEQKRALAAALPEAMVQTIGVAPESIWIVMDDVPRENWAFGGRLGSDPKP